MILREIPASLSEQEKALLQKRGLAVQLAVALLFVILLARLWYLQIAQGDNYAKAAEFNATRLERQPGQRGDIKDRQGETLATTRPKPVVTVDPEEFNVKGPELQRLATCLELSTEELGNRLKPDGPNYKRIRVAVDIPREMFARLKEMQPWLPGVTVDMEDLRFYPGGKLGGHLLGTMGLINPKMLEQYPDIYYGESRVGTTGLEKQYESVLRGVDGGIRIQVDASGNRTGDLGIDPPRRGSDIQLTIDAAVQAAAEKGLTGKVGGAVALDPSTGEVLAIASRPGYDPNLFARGIKAKEYRALLGDKKRPLINRALNVQPPGSTFKLVTALAALQSGQFTASSTDFCAGGIHLGRRFKRCWKRHGAVDFHGAIAESCDVFFYHVGQRIGIDSLAGLAGQFGLGHRLGIDMPGEQGGVVPSPAWLTRLASVDKTVNPTWYPGLTLNVAIGQGDLLCSPLQIAAMAGAVAMHGKLYQPHLVAAIKSQSQTRTIKPSLMPGAKLPDSYYADVIEGMRQCVAAGTGRSAALPGITVGGKTGSAEVGKYKKAHAWFVCVAPLESPRIAVCVFVEHGEHGAQAAAPVAHDMMAAYFRLKNAPIQQAVGD